MIKKYISLILLLLLIYACATVQSPTGGEKDEKAPILYESNPKHQSINFEGTEINLFFNEWMKLEQIQKELIITPRTEVKYAATLKKQELTIELKNDLQDSTTYTFNFRKALSDITEGNLWENPVIAFSTGSYLDSLTVQGNITKLMNQEPAKGYLVGLYDAAVDTANLRQGKPLYFTTTDSEGNFIMKNLRAGNYIIYAFKDTNDNLVNNPQSEAFGFYSDTLQLKDSIPPLTISTYKQNEDTLRVKKYSSVGKDFIVQYNKGLSRYTITNPKDSSQEIYANNIEQSKYLKIYKENFPELAYETDSLQLFIQATDSLNKTRLDTVYFQIRDSRITNEEIKISDTPIGKITTGPQSFTYSFSKPVVSVNYDSLQLRIDTIPIQSFSKNQLAFNFNRKRITLNTLIDENKINYLIDSLKSAADSIQNLRDSLVTKSDSSTVYGQNSRKTKNTKSEENLTDEDIPSENMSLLNQTVPRGNTSQASAPYELQLYTGQGTFMGIESDSTAQSSTAISFKKEADYGIIKGQVINPPEHFIIQLLSEKYELKDTLTNTNDFQFDYVDPGTYRLRLIEDKNANGKWDPGNPFTLQPAENIYYQDEVIVVKANWEVLDKNFDFSVDKNVNESEQNDDL